ncbi:MAG: hypothetical protein LAT55_00495 [Opitutales bacterium]|nr:hypothetical protein [Opitutales bacterium]
MRHCFRRKNIAVSSPVPSAANQVPIFRPDQDHLRWSRFKGKAPEDIYAAVRDEAVEHEAPSDILARLAKLESEIAESGGS